MSLEGFLILMSVLPQVVITEVLVINDAFTDEDGETSDWLELHNVEAETVGLEVTAPTGLTGANLGLAVDACYMYSFGFTTVSLMNIVHYLVWIGLVIDR